MRIRQGPLKVMAAPAGVGDRWRSSCDTGGGQTQLPWSQRRAVEPGSSTAEGDDLLTIDPVDGSDLGRPITKREQRLESATIRS